MSQKSYDNKATLFLIATPIGNKQDITYRAIETLKCVDVIFTEDTRTTSILLNYYKIQKKLISNHQHNEKENKEKLLEYLKFGKNVGLVTDRGTPCVSDPGFQLTKVAIENNYNVVAIPGATAFINALIISSIDPQPFTFIGFLNSKQSKRKKELEELKKLKTTLIFYESPHRIKEMLNDFSLILGDRKCCVCRELTKKYEEIYRGKISQIIEEINGIKGEIVVIKDKNNEKENFTKLTIIEHVNTYIKEGYSSKEAIKIVAKERNKNKNDVYMEYHKGENK